MHGQQIRACMYMYSRCKGPQHITIDGGNAHAQKRRGVVWVRVAVKKKKGIPPKVAKPV